MFLSYKVEDNFREIAPKNILDESISLNSPTECEIDIWCDSFDRENGNILSWEEMMSNGVSPLKEIMYQYQDEVPKFDLQFLNSITIFLRNAPKKGTKILNYILGGPIQNIEALDWNNIFDVLLSYLPNTINIISNSLSIEESGNLHHRSIFLEMGGLSFLYSYSNDLAYQLDLSLILKYLSSYQISNYYDFHITEQKDQDDILVGTDLGDCITDFINCSFSFGIETKPEIEDCESAFGKFCESLLLSEEFDIRINTLEALFSLVENDISFKDIISYNVISHIDKIQNTEELIIVLKILANSLATDSYVTPFISHLNEMINTFLQSTDIQFDDAFCSFIEKITRTKDTEYIYLLGVIDKIVDIANTELPFEIKKNISIILIKIIDSCDPSTFKEIMSEEVFVCIVDFLNLDEDMPIIGILSIIRKLLDNQEDLEVPQNYLDIISSEKESFVKLLDSTNIEITDSSAYVLSFIDYYTNDI